MSMRDLSALLGAQADLTTPTTPTEEELGARRAEDRSVARRSLTRIIAGAALVAVLAVFAAAADAMLSTAALATPTTVAPANGLVVDALPAFSWAAVAKADRYEFQLAADAGMNSPVLGSGDDQFTTRNTRATLKKTIPNGTYWWRVRALQTNGTPSPWSPPRAIVKSWTSAPALQSPTHGAIMVHPTHPLVLRWSTVPRAAKYIVSIATDPMLGTLVSPQAETSGAVYAPRSTLLSPGTYYWGVTPVDAQGHRGAPSPVQSFTWTWPTSTSARVDDIFAAPEVFDPLFSWDPIAGAARYELEINPSVDFAPGSKVCCASPVIGTSYAPTVVFKDNTYYWRVRALDTSGNPGVWNVGPTFTKTFDKVPPTPGPSIKNLRMRDHLADPGSDADPAAAGYQTRVPVLRWDPVPGAASYEVDVAPHTFGICDWPASSGHWRVKTSVPFWAPLGAGWMGGKPYSDPMNVSSDGSINLAAGQGYCARVRARSDRDNANGDVYGDYTYVDDGTGTPYNPKAFTFVGYPDPDRECPGCSYLGAGDYLLPQAGSMNGRTPFFSWKPLPRLPRKTLRNSSNVEALTITEPSPAPIGTGAASFSAAVREHAGDSAKDELVLTTTGGGSWIYAHADGDLSSLEAMVENDPAHTLLVDVHVAGTPLAHVANSAFTSGRQSYYVLVSKDASFSNIVDYAFTQLPVYAPRSSVKPTTYPDETTSYYWAVLPAIGHKGSLASGDPLAASPPSFQKQSTPPAQTAPANGALVELQPTFRWTPVEGARRYRVQVADDPTFGTLIDDVLTDSTAYTSNTSYPADTILYWRVRADDENLIGLTWSTTGTFQRRLPAPVLSAANPGSGEGIPLWTWAAVMGAVAYDVAVDEPDGDHSQFGDFRSAAFTSVKMTGTGIWGWRVRALFPKQLGSQTQPGPWSATKPYTRTIAEPGGARTETSGVSLLLSWNAKPAAKNYRVQISQRADFQQNVEQVDTDNTSYAPTLLASAYLSGGTFWWRVAAQDEDRNIGDFSPAQQFTLAKQPGSGTIALTKLRLATKLVKATKGRRVTVTVRANGRPARGALVRVFARGVTPLKAKTNRYGRVTFRVKKLGRGKRLVRRMSHFRAAKTGFLPGRRSIVIRY
jgi:hypothetical protein